MRFHDGDVEVVGLRQLNLLAHGQLAERSMQSRCGGQCECGTCRVRLVGGRLSPMQRPERELLEAAGVTDPAMRLACQSFPESEDVVVEVPSVRFKDMRPRAKSAKISS